MANGNLSSFIWSVADLLRGDYKQSEYGKVILPFTVLRRLDCVLEPTKAAVLAELATRKQAGLNPEPFLLRKSKQLFYNTSPLDLKKLMGDQDHIGENIRAYIQGFSPAVRDIFENFEFHTQIDKLTKAKLLYLVTEKFATIDLHPDVVSNAEMGGVFEELIRRFAELSNETAGEHFTPGEVIRLMVNLLFIEDDEALTKPGVVRSLYDPTAGTGGMLSVADDHLTDLNPDARLVMYGQELNPESYAICKADMLIKGQDIANIVLGNTQHAKRGRSTTTMRSNCARHFKRTIQILEPTLIVCQGNGVTSWIATAYGLSLSKDVEQKVCLNGTETRLISFTHPSAHGSLNWGWNERTPYLANVVKPAIEKALSI